MLQKDEGTWYAVLGALEIDLVEQEMRLKKNSTLIFSSFLFI
jgi:hypothetical protein